MVVALLISTYMLFDPADWLYDLMQLTDLSLRFEVFLLVLAAGGFACAYFAERVLFPQLARGVGKLAQRIRTARGKGGKKRKEYKVILEGLR